MPMPGFTARNTPYMGLVDRRPVVCRNLAMGFWVPLQPLGRFQTDPLPFWGMADATVRSVRITFAPAATGRPS